METAVPLLTSPKACVCCGAVHKTAHREPLCSACVAPGEIRSYCAKCAVRGAYPAEDFIRIMASHYPHVEFAPGMVVRLPACPRCKDDGRPMADSEVKFLGISFD